VLLVAVNVAVGEEPDEMERSPLAAALGDSLPGLAREDGPAFDGGVHQARALLDDAPGAHGVVADLGVAHVFIGRQPHRGAVSTDGSVDADAVKPVESRRAGRGHRVGLVSGTYADPVHDDEQHRTFRGRTRCEGSSERLTVSPLPAPRGSGGG